MSWQKDNHVALENDGGRVDIVEKVTGRARYTTDYYPEKMIWAAYVRSPVGQGTVKTADLEAARKVEGVLEVEISKKDATYAGDRIGHICAESKAALEEGLAALNLQMALGSPKSRLADERKPPSEFPGKNRQQAEAALKAADVVHEATYETQVQTHSCMEPHGALVDCQGDSAVAWVSTQGTFSARNEVARALEMPQDKVELHCEYIGGGFGSKLFRFVEAALAAQMSKKFNRPCRAVCTRKEDQLDTGNRPGSMQYMKIGVGKDGVMKGGVVHTSGSVGATGGGGGVTNPARYEFGDVEKTHEDVSLSGGQTMPMRAPGRPQGSFGIEMMIDELAAKIGMDPLEFRLKNERNETRLEMMKVGAEQIGWKRRKANGQWPGTVKHGFGMGTTDWGNGRRDSTVEVVIHRDGSVEARSGCQDIGTGFRTMLTDVVASMLGVSRNRITAKCGYSIYPPGPSSGGSVTSRSVAPKAFGAAKKAKEALLKLAAAEMNVDAGSLKLENDTISGGGKTMAFDRACKLITNDHLIASESEDGEFWKDPTGSEGVQFCEVAVDAETGITRVLKVVALQNCGQATNRKTAVNQITGGVIQGVSYALFEDRILNKTNGMMVNANMEMYKIAGPHDVPEIVPILWKPDREVGVNSLGEPPTIPVSGAVGCAVANAIGAPVRTMPITPARVLAAIGGLS